MATNFLHDGSIMEVPAPFNVVSGRVVVIGTNMFGVAKANANSGDNVSLATGGVYKFTKANAVSTSAAAGASAYWDNANSAITLSATGNTRIGVHALAVTNTATDALVRLNPSF